MSRLIIEIKKMQKREGLSDQQLAKELKVDPAMVSRFKNGKQPLTGKLMRAIARTYPRLRKYLYRHMESTEEPEAIVE